MYIADWMKVVRDEPRAFFGAAAKAQAAVDWPIAAAGPLDGVPPSLVIADMEPKL